MGFVLASCLPKASSITAGVNRTRSEQCAKNHYAGSYVTTLRHKTGQIQNKYCTMMSSHSSKHHYKIIEERSKNQEYKRKCVANAKTEQSFDYDPRARDPKSVMNSVKDRLVTFYEFTRPYSAIGVVLETTSVSLLAVERSSDLSLMFFKGWLQGMVVFVFLHVVNCGINQLCDIEIDKINKPYLPLASGQLSFKSGVTIVASSSILGLWFSWMIGSWPLFWTFFINNTLAAIYSVDLPLLRWKKSSILTIINFVASLGVTLPVGYFLHIQTYVFKRPASFPRPLILSTIILSIFCVAIALFKDIPDMEGDEKFGIQSLSLRLGQKRVFTMGISLLIMGYGVAILAGVTSPFLWRKLSTGVIHAILASVMWYHGKSVDLRSKSSIQSFYMFIWKLLSVECLLLPLFR